MSNTGSALSRLIRELGALRIYSNIVAFAIAGYVPQMLLREVEIQLSRLTSESMTGLQIIACVEKEFKEKTLEVTKQYLDIHSPIYVHGKLKVDRIDCEAYDDMSIAYVQVERKVPHSCQLCLY